MSGIRCIPSDDFIKKIVSIFFKEPNLSHVFEINLTFLQKQHICNEMMTFYPELEIYYYPSKLKAFLRENEALTFEGCVCILKQLLRKKGFAVKTKTLKKRNIKETYLIIYPPGK